MTTYNRNHPEWHHFINSGQEAIQQIPELETWLAESFPGYDTLWTYQLKSGDTFFVVKQDGRFGTMVNYGTGHTEYFFDTLEEAAWETFTTVAEFEHGVWDETGKVYSVDGVWLFKE